MPAKPYLFVGSSSKSIEIAEAIRAKLESEAHVIVWSDGTFEAGGFPLESLLDPSLHFEFAVFVFAGDDTIVQGTERILVARDNVVFELGIFMERLGRHRTFVVAPKMSPAIHLPSDLAGLTVLYYDPEKLAPLPKAAVAQACTEIRKSINFPKQHSHRIPCGVVDKISQLSTGLAVAITTPEYRQTKSRHRLAFLYQVAHRHAQSVAEAYWEGADAAVCLKMIDPMHQDRFICLYVPDRLSQRHQLHNRQMRLGCPIDGSVPGWVWAHSKPRIISDVHSMNGEFDDKYVSLMQEFVGSMVAWPLFFRMGRHRRFGVLTVDFPSQGRVSEHDSRLKSLMGNLAANFELAFTLGARENRDLRDAIEEDDEQESDDSGK